MEHLQEEGIISSELYFSKEIKTNIFTKTTMSIENKTTNGSSLKQFNIFIFDFRISDEKPLHNLVRGGTPCILSGATYYRGPAGRAGCWPAISLDLFWWSSYLCEWNLIPQQQHSSQNGNVTSFHPCLCLVLHFVANPKRYHIGQPTTKI